jgi:hypothetical protein
MRRILLVEPSYKNKFPPLGLMKLSTYHKLKGDYVYFAKGLNQNVRNQKWDRIYISTLFTFYWNTTLKTINYYINSVKSREQIVVGGVMATLLGDEIERETGVHVIRGLLDKPGILDKGDKLRIDKLIPDYHILNEIEYEYDLKDSYLSYATRGCTKACDFCAVNIIEPKFVHYLPLKKQIKGIDEIYGPKRNLILMDNNVLASNDFEQIIKDILDLGFQRGAKLGNKKRIVDFNQGTDACFLTRKKMALMAKTAIHPLRIAFDHMSMKELYVSRIKMARDHDLLNLSNYVLYNYLDTPNDFYQRLKINVILNKQLGTKIYSFPMKYIPLNAKDRLYVGKHWNRKILRGIQCVLVATRGMVSPRIEFFKAAFGSSFKEFIEIVYMPEEYIIHRRKHEANGAFDWKKNFVGLKSNERTQFIKLISTNSVNENDYRRISSIRIKRLLSHYIESNNN